MPSEPTTEPQDGFTIASEAMIEPEDGFMPDYKDGITILVGPEKQQFTVHTANICNSSKFFEAAVSAHWNEGKDKPVELLGTEPHIFSMYMNWVYTSYLCFSALPNYGHLTIEEIFEATAKLWILADMLLNPKLCDEIIDFLLGGPEVFHYIPATSKTLQYIWEHTAQESPLRKFHVDRCTASYTKEEFETEASELPREFLVEFAARLLAGGNNPPTPGRDDRCRYHLHADLPENCGRRGEEDLSD